MPIDSLLSIFALVDSNLVAHFESCFSNIRSTTNLLERTAALQV